MSEPVITSAGNATTRSRIECLHELIDNRLGNSIRDLEGALAQLGVSLVHDKNPEPALPEMNLIIFLDTLPRLIEEYASRVDRAAETLTSVFVRS
jgi:hypothetical protein